MEEKSTEKATILHRSFKPSSEINIQEYLTLNIPWRVKHTIDELEKWEIQ
jgi:hypothetical protein